MATNVVTSTARTVLEDTPARVLTFLRGIGTSVSIRALMGSAGYGAAEHEQGWNLLFKASGYPPPAPTSGDNAVADAIRELDAWDEGGFRRARAALKHLHPAQDAFVFENLEPSTGMQALVGIATFLDRLDALENGAARKATRKADHAALATLAARGITPAERKRLRALLDVAHSCPPVVVPAEQQTSDADPRTTQLLALRAWYEDWSETARAVVTRRDQRIRLGLAKRKARARGPGAPVDPVAPIAGAPSAGDGTPNAPSPGPSPSPIVSPGTADGVSPSPSGGVAGVQRASAVVNGALRARTVA